MIEERLFLLATFENIGFFLFKNIYKKVDEPKCTFQHFLKCMFWQNDINVWTKRANVRNDSIVYQRMWINDNKNKIEHNDRKGQQKWQ